MQAMQTSLRRRRALPRKRCRAARGPFVGPYPRFFLWHAARKGYRVQILLLRKPTLESGRPNSRACSCWHHCILSRRQSCSILQPVAAKHKTQVHREPAMPRALRLNRPLDITIWLKNAVAPCSLFHVSQKAADFDNKESACQFQLGSVVTVPLAATWRTGSSVSPALVTRGCRLSAEWLERPRTPRATNGRAEEERASDFPPPLACMSSAWIDGQAELHHTWL